VEMTVDANHLCMAPLRLEMWDSLDLDTVSKSIVTELIQCKANIAWGNTIVRKPVEIALQGPEAGRPRSRGSAPLGCAAALIGSDIYDGDDGAVYLVIERPVRKDLELIMNASAVRELPLEGVKVRDHPQDHGLEIGDFDGGIYVGEKAADIAGNESEKLLGFGSEAADGEVAADHDDGDVDAGEQIDEVVVDLGNIEVSASKFVVYGSQFFVGGLQLFLGSFHFLVGAL